jgi:hypothetical protein
VGGALRGDRRVEPSAQITWERERGGPRYERRGEERRGSEVGPSLRPTSDPLLRGANMAEEGGRVKQARQGVQAG